MKTSFITKKSITGIRFLHWVVLLMLATLPLRATQLTIYTNDFESYSDVATSLNNNIDADPTGSEWNIADDTSLSVPTTAGAGVQVINWLAHSGSKSLLLKAPLKRRFIFLTQKVEQITRSIFGLMRFEDRAIVTGM